MAAETGPNSESSGRALLSSPSGGIWAAVWASSLNPRAARRILGVKRLKAWSYLQSPLPLALGNFTDITVLPKLESLADMGELLFSLAGATFCSQISL